MDTFENFAVSDSSRLAFHAAIAAARSHGSNPLFLCGPAGSGKTHLLHAIEAELRSRQPRINILQGPAAELIARLSESALSDEMPRFRQWLAELDAILLDDLRISPRMEHTQEEIFSRLEETLLRGGSVVVASDSPTAEIKAVPRFSRPAFESAVVAELGYPDADARLAIAKRTAERHGTTLAIGLLKSVTEQGERDPRRIQGAVARIVAQQRLAGTPR
jgi:chromosomal replication initiator protein